MPDQPLPASPPQRLPPEPLRRIDWLAVAPWLLLLRVPSTVVGWPLVAGALGAVLLGGVASGRDLSLTEPSSWLRAPVVGFGAFPRSSIEFLLREVDATDRGIATRVARVAVAVGQVFGWAMIGLFIAGRVADRLTDAPRQRLRPSVGAALRLAPRVASLTGFLLAVAWLAFTAWPRVAHALLTAWEPLGVATGALCCLAIAVSVGSVVVVGGLLLGAPLIAPAIAIDGADAFDAVSRAFAYATQRFARLAFYATLAAVIGACFTLGFELIANASLRLTYAAFPPATVESVTSDRSTAESIAAWWTALVSQAVGGVYPAYCFAAATAIYLLLRRDIDGQPLDEMLAPANQPSSAA